MKREEGKPAGRELLMAPDRRREPKEALDLQEKAFG
jgi:hypothetical protein